MWNSILRVAMQLRFYASQSHSLTTISQIAIGKPTVCHNVTRLLTTYLYETN